MAGKISSRINEDTFDLLAGDRDYLDPILKKSAEKSKDENFEFYLGGEQARTFPEKLPDGKFRINYSFPLDNNGDPTDGRLFVVDSYTFDDINQTNFSFHREVFFNQRGEEKGKWRALRDFLNNPNNMPLPTPEQQADFAQKIALTFSRPIDSNLYKNFKGFVGEEMKQLGSPGAFTYLTPIMGSGTNGLKLKIKDAEKLRDRRTHISYIPKKTGYEVVVSYALGDEDPKSFGSLMVNDRFIFLNMDEPVAFKREVVVANGSPDNEHWEERRKKFYQADGKTLLPEYKPSEAGWKKFFSRFKKELLRLEPAFSTIQSELKTELAAESGESKSPGSVEAAMMQMIENQGYRSVSDYEGTLSQVMLQQQGYLDALNQVGGHEFPLELGHLPLDIQVDVSGAETLVKLRYRFADPSFDGIPRGQVTLTETFRFNEKNFEGVERETDFTGPDPDGRLATVHQRLQQMVGSFPDKKNPSTRSFLNQILPYVAPQVLVKPGESAVLAAASGESSDPKKQRIGLSPQEKESLQSLEKIGKDLVPYLYSSSVDPKFRIPILRAIRDNLYQPSQPKTDARGRPVEEPGTDPVQTLLELQGVEEGRLSPLYTQLEELENQPMPNVDFIAALKNKISPIQDRKLLAEALLYIMMGRTDKAAALVPQFTAHQLRGLMEQTLGPIQRQKLNADGLDLMQAVGWDLIAKEAKESDRWFFGKPFNQTEAEASLQSLIEKAKIKARSEDFASPFAVFQSLKEGLSDGEKAERRRLMTHPLTGQLNQIARDPVRDTQGRRYFTFARSNLMNEGLKSSANFVARWVALNLMPPTRSLEGLMVLEALASTQLKIDSVEQQQSILSGISKFTMPLEDPEGLALLPPEEAQAIQSEFDKNYGEMKAEADQEFSLLTDLQKYVALDEASRQAFAEKITKTYGEQMIKAQMGLFYTESFLGKLQEDVEKNPDVNFRDLVLKRRGSEDAMAREIVMRDPLVASLLEASKESTPEARREGYLLVLVQMQYNSAYQPIIPSLLRLIHGTDFPKQRSKEGIQLTYSVIHGMISEPIKSIVYQPLTEKVAKDLDVKFQEANWAANKAIGLRAFAQQIILEKAREKATSHPDQNPLDVISLITEEELDKDLNTLLQKINPQEPRSEARRESLKEIYWEAKAQRKFLSGKPIMAVMAKIFDEGNAYKRAEHYGKLFQQTSAREKALEITVGQIKGQIEEVPAEALKELFEAANYSKETQVKLEALKKIKDEAALKNAVQDILQGPDFQLSHFKSAMTALNEKMKMGELVKWSAQELVEAKPELKEEQKEFILMSGGGQFPRHGIADFIAYTEGHGSVGYRIEQGIPKIFYEATRPTSLVAMTGAMYVGAAVEAGIMIRASSILTEAMPPLVHTMVNGGAVTGSVLAEGLVLNTGQKILDSAFVTRQGQWENYFGDQAATWLTFGLWRGGHHMVGRLGREVLATGKAGAWAGGPVVLKEIPTTANPMGRLRIPLGTEQGAFYQTTRWGAAVENLAQHGAGVSAIMTSQALAPLLHLQPKTPKQGFTDSFFDAANFYVTGLVGAKIAQNLPLGGLTSSIAEMRYKTELLKLQQNMANAKAEPGIPELVDQKLFAEHLEGLNKKAEEIFQAKATPALPAELPSLRQALGALLGVRAVEAMEFKVEADKVWIKDMREGVEKGKDSVAINGKDLVRDKWIAVPEQAVISTRRGEFRFGPADVQGIHPGQLGLAKTLQTLSEIPLANQYSFARMVAGAKDLAGLQKSLETFSNFLLKHGISTGSFQVSQLLRYVQMGAYPLDALPTQLGLKAKVIELMEREIGQAKQDDLDIGSLELKQGSLASGMDSIQSDLIKTRLVRQLDEAIGHAKSEQEILELLSKAQIEKIEGRSIEDLKNDFSNQAQGITLFGLGQKIFDMAENPATIPDLPPTLKLNRLVRSYLDRRTPDDLASTQRVLRYHLDRMTPKARVMLRRSVALGGLTKAQWKGLVDLYLGVEGQRVMPSVLTGLKVVAALGKNKSSDSINLSHGEGRTVLRNGMECPDHYGPVAKAKKGVLEIQPWVDQPIPDESGMDVGAPAGWGRVKTYLPKVPVLPTFIRMPQFKLPIKFSPMGIKIPMIEHIYKMKSAEAKIPADETKKPTGDKEKIDQELEKALNALEPTPATLTSEQQQAAQPRGNLQLEAIQNLTEALRSFGQLEHNQEIAIGVEVGDRTFALKFIIDLPQRQVRLTEHTITDLKNARDGVQDPKIQALYDELIEMKGQPFEVPSQGAPPAAAPEEAPQPIEPTFKRAQELGIVEDVERLAAEGKTAKQIVEELNSRFSAGDEPKILIRVVRAQLKIPAKDELGFKDWLEAYRARSKAE